jgi:hypothetical protein
MPGNRTEKTQIMPARAQRKRTGKAVSFGTTEDNRACLRGPMSGGAEKKKEVNPHGCSRVLFFGLLIALPHSMPVNDVVL